MSLITSKSIRRLAPGLLVLVAVGVTACGSNSSTSSTPSVPAAQTSTVAPATSSSSTATSAPATTTTKPATTTTKPATTTSSSGGAAVSGIPQGATAGDQDADNQGAPSDGDGNV